MASIAELVRSGVRDQLPEPPWRLVRYRRSTGPTVERDVDPNDGVTEGTLQATLAIGSRLAPSIIGHLRHDDPLSAHLQQLVPDDAWFAPTPMPPTSKPSPQRPTHPVWNGYLQTAGGTGDLITIRSMEDTPTDGEIGVGVTELRRQLDLVRIPSLAEMVETIDQHCRLGHGGNPTHTARSLALAYLVRGQLDEGLRLVELSREAYLRTAGDVLIRQPRRVAHELDEVQRLERFAAWLPTAPIS
ncbi:hypothetical protein [Klenkia sp. PcliD-1-E]|uniref:hypothetical protein n=1 Tax=Klenkia sp. PcliD-1-E TaxID=2954492 RepID=UPI0020971F38|nr:hypothetical protein [Klenkia sp. PcliD-1-E]MCO7221540.1 hypothetical protein [Klenkia sp. PcliD-1-E]